MLAAGARPGMCRKVRLPGPARSRLGKAWSRTDNRPMSDEPQAKGFEFPGIFEITAMGPSEARLEQVIPRELQAAGLVVLQETVRSRASSAGRFVSVAVSF